MSRIFISGSSAGLGLMAADRLINQGHKVVLHARNAARAEDARRQLPKTEAIVTGDVETIDGAKDIAAQVNALGRFDAVIQNAAVGYREASRVTADGLPHVFAINTLSAYILTALITAVFDWSGATRNVVCRRRTRSRNALVVIDLATP